jgi:hypothetical protein
MPKPQHHLHQREALLELLERKGPGKSTQAGSALLVHLHVMVVACTHLVLSQSVCGAPHVLSEVIREKEGRKGLFPPITVIF